MFWLYVPSRYEMSMHRVALHIMFLSLQMTELESRNKKKNKIYIYPYNSLILGLGDGGSIRYTCTF